METSYASLILVAVTMVSDNAVLIITHRVIETLTVIGKPLSVTPGSVHIPFTVLDRVVCFTTGVLTTTCETPHTTGMILLPHTAKQT